MEIDPQPPDSATTWRKAETSQFPRCGVGTLVSCRSFRLIEYWLRSTCLVSWVVSFWLWSGAVILAAPGDIDPTFVSGIRTSSVNTAVILPDQTLFVGGYFENDLIQKALAKIRADGTLDLSFRPRFTIPAGYGGADVNQIALDRNDHLLIVGHFTHINGTARNGFARIDQTGAVDLSFDPAINDEINCLEIQADGKIVIGGEFTSVGGFRRPFLARLNEDGTVDPGFAPLSGAGSPVTRLKILADGKIIAGGSNFITSSGIARKGLIRLLPGGDLDLDFNPPLSAGRTDALAIQQDGKVIAGGYFTATSPVIQTEVLRFNTDGSVDSGFLPNMEMTGYTEGMYTVQSLATQADGKILIGGGFDKINGSTRRFLARLNSNGTVDASFASNASSWVTVIAQQNQGDIIISQNNSLLVQPFTNFFRLSNPSTDSLSFPGPSTVRWTRGATTAAISGVEFSAHENGVWQTLGNATSTLNGWELSGVTLPANGVVRARPLTFSQRNLEKFTTIGNPTPAFEIAHGGGEVISDSQVINFDAAWSGASNERRFTLRNTGNAILQPLTFSFSGAHPTDFKISGLQQIPLAPGGKQEFILRFTPAAPGARSANLQFVTSQGGLSSLGMALQGSTTLSMNPVFSEVTGSPVAIAEGFSTGGKSVGIISLGFVPPLHTELMLINNLMVQTSASSQPNPNFLINGTFADLPDQAIIQLVFGGQNYPFLVSYTGGDGNDLTLSLIGEETPDPDFAVQMTGATSSITSWTLSEFLTDGRFFVGGSFTTINGASRIGIARLNAEGMLDPTFQYRGGVAATAMASLPDGKILLAGRFENESTSGAIALARLNEDGSIDQFLVRSINATVTALIVRPDQKILMLGNFSSVGGLPRNRVALLNADGTLDATYNPSVSGAVDGGSLLPDGKLLLRGSFTGVGNVVQRYLARLNADGTLDESFNPVFKAEGINSTPLILASLVQPDGKVVIGGRFIEIDGVFRDNIVRLNPDGSVDEGFLGQADGEVNDLYLLQNGKLLVSGSFKAAGGVRPSNIARLLPDGAVDPSFLARNTPPNALSGVTRSGRLLLRNGTRLLGMPTASSLEILTGDEVFWQRSDGLGEIGTPRFEFRAAGSSAWVNLGVPVKVPNGWKVAAQALTAPGAVRARGFGGSGGKSMATDHSHAVLGSEPAAVVIRDSSGAIFNSGSFADFGSTIPVDPEFLTLTIENTSSAVIQGLNASISGTHAADFVLDGLSGNSIPPFGSVTARIRFIAQTVGLKASIFNIGTGSGGSLGQVELRGEIGSGFSPTVFRYSDSLITPADFNAGLYSLETFTLDFQPISGRTITLLKSPGASLGTFSNAPSGSIVSGIYQDQAYSFRVSYPTQSNYQTVVLTYIPYGTADSTFNAALNASGGGALAVLPDGKILFSGGFSQAGGQPHQRIARMNADGTVDHGFQASTNAMIESMAIQPDGKILVAGAFTLMNGVNRRGLARLHPDGRLDESYNAGLNDIAARVVSIPGGGCYVIGPFTSVGGIARVGIARLLIGGQVDQTFNTDLRFSFGSYPLSILVQPDGKVLLGGGLMTLRNGSSGYLKRFLPDGSPDILFDPVLNNFVSAMAFDKSGKLLIGGSFTTVAGQSRGRIARLHGDGAVDMTFSNSNAANSTVVCIAVQASGRIMVGGQFSVVDGHLRPAVARLHSNGALDPSFVPAGTASLISSVALTDEGRMVVCGSFTSLGGVARSGLTRLNMEAGVDHLEVAADHLQWNRIGTLAELDSAVFTYSSDGENWNPLGHGVRNGQGWELAGITTPVAFIRAEGRHSVSNRAFGIARNTRLFGRTKTALENWREGHFGSPLSEGPAADSADPDYDGVNNLLEYAFGLSPVDNASRLLPTWVSSGSTYEISFQKPASVEGLTYSGEWSSTLEVDDWQPAEDLSVDGWLKFRVGIAGGERLFVRLKASRP